MSLQPEHGPLSSADRMQLLYQQELARIVEDSRRHKDHQKDQAISISRIRSEQLAAETVMINLGLLAVGGNDPTPYFV